MKIPPQIQRRMQGAENASAEGVTIAVELLERVRETMADRIAGIYLMPPFKRYDMAVEILERIGMLNSVAG